MKDEKGWFVYDLQVYIKFMMFNSLIIKVKQQNYHRYNQAFNFFQSKSINAIVSSRKVDYAILYRDFQFYDDRTQYLKRYYTHSETLSRIKKLINYYQNNLSAPNPNLLLLPQYPIIETHNRKIIKLCIMRDKSLAKRSARLQAVGDNSKSNNVSADNYLNLIDQSNYSDTESQKNNQNTSRYDSQVHNAYDGLQVDAIYPSKIFDFNQLKSIEESYLIIQFQSNKDNNPLPQINNQPAFSPIQIMVLPEKKKTSSVSVQTLPFELPSIKKPQKQKQKSIQKQKPKFHQRIMPVPQFQKFLPPTSPMVAEPIAFSQIKNQNLFLTESIQLVKKKQEEKKKTSTFMEYYNSIPVKSPSNILQRFVKKKK